MTSVTNDATPSTLLLLGKLDGKLDALIAQTGRLTQQLDELEKRTSSLEKWRAWVLGAAAAAGAVGDRIADTLVRSFS